MIRYFKQTVAPVVEAITWAAMKSQLRLRTDEDQTLVEGLISAAVETIQARCNRVILPSTWQAAYSEAPCKGRLALPGGPVRTISSVEIQTAAGTISAYGGSYEESLDQEPPILRFADDGFYPPETDGNVEWVFRVTYETGYADVASIPSALIVAIGLQVEQTYLQDSIDKYEQSIETLTRQYVIPSIISLSAS